MIITANKLTMAHERERSMLATSNDDVLRENEKVQGDIKRLQAERDRMNDDNVKSNIVNQLGLFERKDSEVGQNRVWENEVST
jgi:hypothetical protein